MALELDTLLDTLDTRIKALAEKVNASVAAQVGAAKRVESQLNEVSALLDTLGALEVPEAVEAEEIAPEVEESLDEAEREELAEELPVLSPYA